MTDLKSNEPGIPGGSKTETQVNEAVNIRLPTFWPSSIATWFVQVEAQFTIGRILSDQKRYNYVVAALPQDVAESLMDLFQNPPEVNLYKTLKDTLIQRHSLSLEKRIKQLVSDEEIGDRKPSDFYRRMKQLAGATAAVGDEFLMKLWLSRLPHLINIALIPQSEGNLDTLLLTADRIWEAMQTSSSVSQINDRASTSNSTNSSCDRFSKLEQEINSLKSMISNINFRNSRPESKSKENNVRNNSRQRSNSRRRNFNPQGSLCWYHYRYGDQARKCVQPCTRNSSASASNEKPSSSKN